MTPTAIVILSEVGSYSYDLYVAAANPTGKQPCLPGLTKVCQNPRPYDIMVVQLSSIVLMAWACFFSCSDIPKSLCIC